MKAPGAIEQIASAVLYEGFLLYPYRLSSVKNRNRWNFGVLYPAPFGSLNGDRESALTECLLEAGENTRLDVKIRFLQLVDGAVAEREVLAADLELEKLTCRPHESLFPISGVEGKLEVRAAKTETGVFQVTVKISNLARFNGKDRDEALACSLISTHAILTVRGGRFVSLIDPPEKFQAAAAQCRNAGLWPVLVGRDDDQVLSSPIILYDHPRIAPQSPGDLFDSTEIDEILTLRIQTLTDGEKQEMRATDRRARALLERSEALTREELSKLHAPMHREPAPRFKKGDRVRLQPRRRADIFDIALAGKLATVVSVEQDFEDGVHVCVTVDDDPGRDLGVEGKPGHRFFFGSGRSRTRMSAARILIAGIGNIFLGDDAFGVEVVKRLAVRSLPPNVRVADFGIRGIDLTYALLQEHELIILVDTMQRGGKPGDLYVIEPLLENDGAMETHEMAPAKALAAAKAMGATLTNVVIVGCEPESFGSDDEPQMELSRTVEAAVDEAVALIEAMAVKGREAARA